MLVVRAMEEANVLSITATPFAQEEVNPQSDALEGGQFVVERLGLKTACLAAIG
jgi:hypothetical protein